MASNFHEDYAEGHVEMPSDRSTGLVFAGLAALVAILHRHDATWVLAAGGVAVALLAASLVMPRLLHPLNVAWFLLGRQLHKIMSPLVMGLVFGIAFVPMGLIMRLRHDPLHLRRDPAAATYWIARDPEEASRSSMVNQF